MPGFDLNYLAVLAAAVSSMVLGFLWYGPIFGNMWLSAVGKTREDLGSPTSGIVISAVSALVTALVLAMVLKAVGADTTSEGVVWGVVAAIGFVATSGVTNAAYESRGTTVTVLFIGYQVIALGVMGVILTIWM